VVLIRKNMNLKFLMINKKEDNAFVATRMEAMEQL
jgi:hypothetical protein